MWTKSFFSQKSAALSKSPLFSIGAKMSGEDEIQVEYVVEEPIVDQADPSFGEFAKILDAFKVSFALGI